MQRCHRNQPELIRSSLCLSRLPSNFQIEHACSPVQQCHGIDSVSVQRVIGRRDLSCKGAKATAMILPLLTVLRIMSDAFILRRSSESVESKLLIQCLRRCSGKVDSGYLCLSIPTDCTRGEQNRSEVIHILPVKFGVKLWKQRRPSHVVE